MKSRIYAVLFTPWDAFDRFARTPAMVIISLIFLGALWNVDETMPGGFSQLNSWSSAVVSAGLGFVGYFLFAVLTCWLVYTVGGSGTFRGTLEVVAWAMLPGLLPVFFSFVMLLLGVQFLGSGNGSLMENFSLALNVVCSLWFFFILLNGLSEIHHVPVRRIVLGGIAVFVIMMMLLFLFTLLSKPVPGNRWLFDLP